MRRRQGSQLVATDAVLRGTRIVDRCVSLQRRVSGSEGTSAPQFGIGPCTEIRRFR
jgi:hypothetical protein